MTDMEILQLADQCGVIAVTKHEWDGKQFNHTDDYLDGDGAALIIFAKAIAQRTWVGLTDEDKEDWIKSMPWPPEHRHIRILIDGIESELKEKNS